MIQLQYVGHASWLIFNDRVRILCDPWLNPHGVFFSSWFQFPANDHLDIDDLKQVDLIYLSHTHEDHFDPWFLDQVDKSIPILAARFDSSDLRNRVADLGFEQVIELEEERVHSAGGLDCRIYKDEDHGMYFDSALLVSDAMTRVLNQNDCRLDETIAKRIGDEGGVDALLKFYSGASAFPLAYQYDESAMKQHCANKRKRSLASLISYGQMTQARVVIPCSGPAAFLDDELFHWNDFDERDENPFPNMATAVRYVEAHDQVAELVMPGDLWSVSRSAMELQARTLEPDEVYGDVKRYLTEYAARKRPIINERLAQLEANTEEPGELLHQRVEEIAASQHFLQNIDLDILWEFTGAKPGKFWMSLHADDPPKLEPFHEQPFQYRYTIDSRYAVEILRRRAVDWEDFFLSLRFSAWREPDLFNYYFYSLLKHMDRERLEEAEQAFFADRREDEMFDLEHDGRQLRVQRYCPHLGSDLSEIGVIEGDQLVCPRHGWTFCLQTGKCLNVEGEQLHIELFE